MYIQRNKSTGKNGKVYTSTLLCTKYREEGKIKTRVEANLSHMPQEMVLGIENMLKHEKGTLVANKDIAVKKAIDFGLVFLLIHLMDKLHISKTLEKTMPDQAAILKGIIIGKVITRGSKLGIYNWLKRNRDISLKLGLDIENTKLDEIYAALGTTALKQPQIERKWFIYNKSKHKEVYLYDITSTYFEGTENELAAFGYDRDKKKGKMQINIALLTDSEGFPLKIEVFQGNTQDHQTVLAQIDNIKKEFDAKVVVFVGDRGMKIRYNLETMNEADKEGIQYITGLTHPEIRELLKNDILQLDLFSKDIAEVEHAGERYILSVNPALQEKELNYLKTIRAIVDDEISDVKAAWEKRRQKNIENAKKLENGHKNKNLVIQFSGKNIDSYKLRVENILSKRHMSKYYQIVQINDDEFTIDFKAEKYLQAKQLAGKYVICTGIDKDKMDKHEVRKQYKNLQHVEHAFRDLKSDYIQVRPVFVRNQAQTRGHVLLSMFSYAIIKEMENKIFPFLKSWNKKAKSRLAFADIIEELKDIKLVELNLGRNVDTLKITELNELQKGILKLFDMNKKHLDKSL
ncbi:MAG TPA: IS1634 family transposase [Treponemataceae bacterium]|nr:IS1634 family transposase [Treponemataceae bacterium]